MIRDRILRRALKREKNQLVRQRYEDQVSRRKAAIEQLRSGTVLDADDLKQIEKQISYMTSVILAIRKMILNPIYRGDLRAYRSALKNKRNLFIAAIELDLTL